MRLFTQNQLTKAVGITMLTMLSIMTNQAATAADSRPTITEGQSLDSVIAIVNDTAILRSDLNEAVTEMVNQLKAEKQPQPPLNQLYPQVLNQLISRQMQLDVVTRQGYEVDENQLNLALTNIAKQNGVSSLSALQQKLDSQKKGSYQTLRKQVSEDMAIQALQQQQVSRHVNITEQDVDAFLTSPESNVLEQSQYRPFHIRVPYGNAKGENVSEQQKQNAQAIAQKIVTALQTSNAEPQTVIANLQKNYRAQIKGGDVGFRTVNELPVDIAKDIIKLQVGEVSKPLPTEQGIDIIKLIDKKESGKHIIDQWQTRHILISPSANVSPEMAKQHIDIIYKQLQNGADFATLAATYSKDGSASNGGSLGWVSEGEMVAPFEAMMKQTAVNDFSVPFQTQFGWHILKVDAIRKQDVTDIYRRNMAREMLYQRLAPQALEDWLQELRSQSYVKILEE